MLFCFQTCGYFPEIFLFLLINLNALLSENILCAFWTLLPLLRLILWRRIGPLLIMVMCALKRESVLSGVLMRSRQLMV